MNLTIQLPDNLTELIAAQIASQAEKIARGNQLITLREATQITRHRRSTIMAAKNAKALSHFIVSGKPHFLVSDLWQWMEQFRVKAKSQQ